MFALRKQSPVGERIKISKLLRPMFRSPSEIQSLSSWQAFGSGTMALAATLKFLKSRCCTPQWIAIPAYSCPDILAAAEFSGLSIHYLDTAPGGVSPSADSFADSIRRGARVAVLVDLFGSSSPVNALRATADKHAAWLVHDRAQCHAGPGLPVDSDSDFVIVSRGRGKPATLIHGGAAWARDEESFERFVSANFPLSGWHISAAVARAAAYNLALNHLVFNIVALTPGMGVGRTALRPVGSIARLPAVWLQLAATQLHSYRSDLVTRRLRTVQLCEEATAAGLHIPFDVLETAYSVGLNRLPVVCRDIEQALFLRKHGAALGVSEMYGQTLPEFVGHSPSESAAEFPNAHKLSRTLVTLPTHSRVSGRALRALVELLRAAI